MTLRTITFPSGRTAQYDDKYSPYIPTEKDAYMGLLGNVGSQALSLGMLYGAGRAGLLGQGVKDAIRGTTTSALAASTPTTAALAAPGVAPTGSAALADVLSPTGAIYSAEEPALSVLGGGALSGTSEALAEPAVGFFDSGGGLLGSGEMGAGSYLPGVAGTAMAYDAATHPHRNRFLSAGEGALAGAGIGYTVGGPVGAIIGAPVGAIGGGLLGGHKSTKQREKEHIERLRNMSTDPNWQATVDIIHARDATEGIDPAKLNGQEFNFERLRPTLKGGDLSYTHGVNDLYGPEYQGYTPEQKQAIEQQLLDRNLIISSKGDIEITNPAEARRIRDEVLGRQTPAPQLPPQYGPTGRVSQVM